MMDNSPWKNLPAEIRNLIYASVLCSPLVIVPTLFGGDRASPEYGPELSCGFALAAVCRSIRHETRAMSANLNCFIFPMRLMPSDYTYLQPPPEIEPYQSDYADGLRSLLNQQRSALLYRLGTVELDIGTWKHPPGIDSEDDVALPIARALLAQAHALDILRQHGVQLVAQVRVEGRIATIDGPDFRLSPSIRLPITDKDKLNDVVSDEFSQRFARLNCARRDGTMTKLDWTRTYAALRNSRQHVRALVAALRKLMP